MTREDIILMAQQAYGAWYPNAVPPELERFANLVAANTKAFCPVCNQRDAVRAKFDEESG